MTVFCVDLDNTLIYSYKRFHSGQVLAVPGRCVERYNGRKGAFMSERSWELLREISKKVPVVPVTTRTVEQYRRVDLGIGDIPYALVCNGGVLLADGGEDGAWYRESLGMIRDCRRELEEAAKRLEKDAYRCFEIREIQGLFLFTKFTKSGLAEESAARLRRELNSSFAEVFCSGAKVYVMPKMLTKGTGILRLKKKLGADRIIAAGDSELDIPMLECADVGIAPAGTGQGDSGGTFVRIGEERLFSEGMLEYVLCHIL